MLALEVLEKLRTMESGEITVIQGVKIECISWVKYKIIKPNGEIYFIKNPYEVMEISTWV